MSAVRAAVDRWLDAPDESLPPWARPLRFGLRLVLQAGRQLLRDRATLMASAITYRTVFALVPVLIVSLVVLRFFLGTDAISDALDALLKQFGMSDLSLGEASAEGGGPATVADWLQDIVTRAEGINFGAIGAVGGLLLIYAAVSMLIQIETCFNIIYAAPAGRKIATRLTTYWTMLTLGPLGVIASLTLGRRLGAALEPLGGFAAGTVDATLGVGISWLILLVAYLLIPNTKVKLRPAAIGALLAALLWELAKQAFRSYLGFSTGYAALYGSLGLVPVFFLWVFVTWLIVLLGLEVTRSLQILGDPLHADPQAAPPADPACALSMLVCAAGRFGQSRPMTLSDAALAADLPPRAAESILDSLVDACYLHRVDTPQDEAAYALAREVADVRAADVARALAPDQSDATPVRRVLRARYEDVTLDALVREAGEQASP